MNFVCGLLKESDGDAGIAVFVDHVSKMAHLEATPDSIDGKQHSCTTMFIDRVFR